VFIYLFLAGDLAYCCRLTPVYMILIGVLASLFVYFGDGPLWLYTDPEYDTYGACKDNWWTNLLYVNNLVHSNRQVCCIFLYNHIFFAFADCYWYQKIIRGYAEPDESVVSVFLKNWTDLKI